LIVESLAMATGKTLLDIKPAKRLRVWYYNGEDPSEELQRRFAAVCLHYGIEEEDIGSGYLFVDSGRIMPIVLAEEGRHGIMIAVPVIEQVIATIRAKGIDVVIIDPFISTHRVPENDNGAIERVAKSWGHIAEVTNCSVMLAHHTEIRREGSVYGTITGLLQRSQWRTLL
jgi:RecA-family ATPase